MTATHQDPIFKNGCAKCASSSSNDLTPPTKPKKKRLMFSLNDTPPWYLTIILGFQQYLLMFGGTVAIPYIVSQYLCIRDDDPARAYLISTAFFISGIVTLIQCTFGSRLPIIQGASSAFLVPVLSILELPQWKCPSADHLDKLDEGEKIEVWQERIREIQGAIIVASMVEVVIGLTGLVGRVVRWITPLTIVPTITMVGLSLFTLAGREAGQSWPFAKLTIVLLIVFSQYLTDVGIPCGKKKIGDDSGSEKGLITTKTKKLYLFKLFSVLFSMLIVWSLCAILTGWNILPPDHKARTDQKWIIVKNSPWFRMPYPFQWGWPTFTTSSILGLLAGVIASCVDTLGDYFACARLCEAPAPPTHAINRGIFIEGVGCVLSGIWGFGGGLASYSLNIGAIGVTRVGSRSVTQAAAILMLILSLLPKLGAFFVTMPPPIMGGVFCVTFSMIVAVGLSALQYVDLNSTRNLFVLGFSVFMGLVVPNWISAHPHALDTGYPEFDNIIRVTFSIGIFVAGLLGFVLDNTIPGTLEERGIERWMSEMQLDGKDGNGNNVPTQCYDLPFGLTKLLQKSSITRRLPISPGFNQQDRSESLRSERHESDSSTTPSEERILISDSIEATESKPV